MVSKLTSLLFATLFFLEGASLASGQSNGHLQAINGNKDDQCKLTLDDPRGEIKKLRYLLNSTHLCCPCNPGERLVALCKPGDYQSTRCVKCDANTFIEKHAHEETICTKDDRTCPPDQYLIPSTRELNSRCDCRHGFKLKEEDACQPHTKCKPGSGVKALGTPHSDTECIPCQRGYASPNFSSNETCQLKESIRHHPKNKHFFETTEKPISPKHNNLLHEETTFSYEAPSEIPDKDATSPMLQTNGANEADGGYHWPPNMLQIMSGTTIAFAALLVCWLVRRLCTRKRNWHFGLCDDNEDVEKVALQEGAAVYIANPALPSRDRRAEEAPSIEPEASDTNSHNSDDALPYSSNEDDTEESPANVSREIFANNSQQTVKMLSEQAIHGKPKSPIVLNTYCRRKLVKEQKQRNAPTQDKETRSELLPASPTTRPSSDSRVPTHPPFISEDETAALLESTFSSRSSESTPSLDKAYSTEHETDELISKTHTVDLMYDLMMALSTQVSRDLVKKFYRMLSGDKFESQQVIKDLERNNPETSEMFIAAFIKLRELGSKTFNPQLILHHFNSQHNTKLAHFVEDFLEQWKPKPRQQ